MRHKLSSLLGFFSLILGLTVVFSISAMAIDMPICGDGPSGYVISINPSRGRLGKTLDVWIQVWDTAVFGTFTNKLVFQVNGIDDPYIQPAQLMPIRGEEDRFGRATVTIPEDAGTGPRDVIMRYEG